MRTAQELQDQNNKKQKRTQLGHQLYQLRTTFGLSRKQVAEELNVTPMTIFNWETTAIPLYRRLKKLERFYDTSLVVLYWRTHQEIEDGS